MTPPVDRTGRQSARRATSPQRRMPSLMGIPVPLIALALVGAVLMGLLLSRALDSTTNSRAELSTATVREGSGAGRNASGLPVITDTTVGPEVQRLVESGTVAPASSFNAAQCLEHQGITDQLLIMEEISWGPSNVHGWLLVHGPVDSSTLRAAGGVVSTMVVTDTCGEDDAEDPRDTRLWAGSVMIGGV